MTIKTSIISVIFLIFGSVAAAQTNTVTPACPHLRTAIDCREAVNLLLAQSTKELSTYPAEPIQVMLQAIAQFDGLTYAEVRRDTDSYKKLIDAYQYLRNHADLRQSNLESSSQKIDFIITNSADWDIVPSPSVAQLSQDLKELATLGSPFIAEVINCLHSFQPDNKAVIDTTDLQNQFDKIESLRKQASNTLSAELQTLFIQK